MHKQLLTLMLAISCICGLPAAAQEKTVSGAVHDSGGEPLIGATVQVKGTDRIAVTDLDGRFVLAGIEDGAVLRFSYTGMTAREIAADGRDFYDVEMTQDMQFLDEIVVVGYGTTTKRKLVGSVSTVDPEKLEQMPFTNIAEALQGQVPGLIVQGNGGGIGATPSISIRGGETPLFVIDGVVATELEFSVLNPEDIASISFLKDAAATAVYGSRAGAGIVQVTTKRGSDRAATVTYSTNLQISQPTVLPERADAFQYVESINNAYAYEGIKDPFMTPEGIALIGVDYRYPNNDYVDLIFKDFAFEQKHNVSVSGGSENTKYYVSLGYLDKNGMIETGVSNMDRVNFRSSFSHNFDRIGLEFGSVISAFVQNVQDPVDAKYNRAFYFLTPLAVCYNPDGTMASSDQNPLKEIYDGSGYDRQRRKQLNAQMSLTWSPKWIKGLKIGAMASYVDSDYFNKIWDSEIPSYSWNPDTGTSSLVQPKNKPQLTEKSGYDKTLDFEARISYLNTFGKHTIDALLLYTQTTGHANFIEVSRKDYEAEIDQIFAGPLAGMASDGYESESARAGLVMRLKYDYDSRYIIEFSGRYDGTDQFAKGHRWGFFPAVSGVWMMSDEPFMAVLKDRHILDMLKIRASYGLTGLSGNTRFGYMQTYAQTDIEDYLDIGGSLQTGYKAGALVDPDALSWYSRSSFNIGFDFGSLGNSLSGSLDYFYYKTTGYLMSPNLSYSGTLGTNLPQVRSNSEHRREGMEFTLRYKKNIGDWFLSIGGNIAYYTQMWARLDTEDIATLKNPYTRETQQTDYFSIAYITDGLYRTPYDVINSPRPLTSVASTVGEINYVDTNGDGKIDSNDMRRAGNSLHPHLTYGIDFSVSYRGFTLSGLFSGAGRRSVNIGNTYRDTDVTSAVNLRRLENTWSPHNPDGEFPRLFSTSGYNGSHEIGFASDITLKNGSYLRLKNLVLSYDLKHSLLKDCRWLSSLRLSLIGTNLFTISGIYKYIDPETLMLENIGVGGASRDGSGASYPVSRTFSLGLNIGF